MKIVLCVFACIFSLLFFIVMILFASDTSITAEWFLIYYCFALLSAIACIFFFVPIFNWLAPWREKNEHRRQERRRD